MLSSFLTFINQLNLDLPSQPTLLTVSGGVDSIVMTNLFHRAGLSAGIVHCNFGLRGKESEMDEAFVRKLGEHYDFPVFVKHFDTKVYAKEQSISTQMAARDLRYTWFEEIRKENAYNWIATAHHANDALETALLNLVRGTGIAGLHGISAHNRFVIRPLLFASKEEILDYAEQNKLTWREDRSNDSLDYKRNVIRKKVVPVLKELNPSLENTFLVTSERILAAEALLNEHLTAWKKEAVTEKKGELNISIKALLNTTEPVYRLWNILDNYGFNYAQIPLIIKSLNAISGKVFYSESHSLLKDRDRLILKRINKEEKVDSLIINKFTGTFTFYNQNLILERQIISSSFSIEKKSNVVYLDEDKLILPLTVRKWISGDAFFPFGMNGNRKKVSDLLVDLKLTIYQKQEVNVLLNGNGEIIWVIDIRADERYRITEKTENIIKIVWENKS